MSTVYASIDKGMALVASLLLLTLAAMFGEAEMQIYLQLYGTLGTFLLLILIALEMVGYAGTAVEITRHWTSA